MGCPYFFVFILVGVGDQCCVKRRDFGSIVVGVSVSDQILTWLSLLLLLFSFLLVLVMTLLTMLKERTAKVRRS